MMLYRIYGDTESAATLLATSLARAFHLQLLSSCVQQQRQISISVDLRVAFAEEEAD